MKRPKLSDYTVKLDRGEWGYAIQRYYDDNDKYIDYLEAKFNNVGLANVRLSAYLVDNGNKQLIVMAKNMADACDKLDANGYKEDYVFTKAASIDVLY